MEITRSVFESQRRRRFGASNPEPMSLEFWVWMIRNSEESRIRDRSDESGSAYRSVTPTDCRRLFGQEEEDDDDESKGPIWNFDRMGTTRTPHPDGRLICIGGEHEDWYDRDFCIYNDVAVLDLDGSTALYGYPRDVFPPTDFHTATLLGGRVIVVGRLGYQDERRTGETPVMALDLESYRFEPFPSLGEAPGWIFGHEAECAHGVITVRGGEIWEVEDGSPRTRRNFDDFAYEVGTGLWSRLTRRNWRQYSITNEDGRYYMRGTRLRDCSPTDDEPWACVEEDDDPDDGRNLYVPPRALRPRIFPCEEVEAEEANPEDRFLVAGIPVAVSFEPFHIEVVIEEDVDEATAGAIAEDVRAGVEEETGRKALLRKIQ